MPFLYVICCSSNKSTSLRDYSRLSSAGINQNVGLDLPDNDTIVLSEALFLNNQLIQDLNTDTPSFGCNAVMSKNEPHIALVNTEALDQISDAVCNSGSDGMCCIVRSNSKLKCCQDDICREVSFYEDRKNNYLINNEKIFVISPNQEIKTYNILKEQSFNIYDYLMKLNRAYADWASLGEEGLLEDFKEVLQEVRKIFTGLLNKVKNKMPGLLEREIVALYICENDFPLSIGNEITGKKEISIDDSLLGKNLFSIIRYDGVKSKACKLDFDYSLCALSILKIDYSEIVKVKLTDSDIERILAHELGHIIQTKNPISFYFFDDDEDNKDVFRYYIARNTEIDADLKSQLAVNASQLNFDTVMALLRLDFLGLNYFNQYVTIDKKFNCFKNMADAPRDLQPLPEHPDLRCRIAYVLSLSEAMEKMHKFFKNLEHPEMDI